MGKFLSAITAQPAYFVSQQIVRVVGVKSECECEYVSVSASRIDPSRVASSVCCM